MSDVLREYYDDSGYIMKALYYASRSAYYYQLCINNSSLAYLLLRKEDWNPAHPLYEQNPLDVVGEKQEVMCELLGYSRSHAKILRKIPPHHWEREYFIRSPKEFRKILNHPRVVKLIHGIKSLSYGSISIIRCAYEYGWLDRLEVSLLAQILLLENNGNFCSQVLNRGTLERFTYQNPGRDKRNISIEDIVTVWRECMEFNRNWRIKIINSFMVAFDKYTVSESDMEMNYEGYLDWDWDEIFIPLPEDEKVYPFENSLRYKELWDGSGLDEEENEGLVYGYMWKLSEIKGVGNREAPKYVMDELRKWFEWGGWIGEEGHVT